MKINNSEDDSKVSEEVAQYEGEDARATIDSKDMPRARKKSGPPVDRERQKTFLNLFKTIHFKNHTCQQMGMNPSVVDQWLVHDPWFREEYQKIEDNLTEVAENAAYNRGIMGYQTPVIYKGQMCYQEAGKDKAGKPIMKPLMYTEYSDRLLEMILKARAGEKYKEKSELDQKMGERIAHYLAGRFLAIIRKHIPEVCPGCKTRLDLTAKIADELMLLSEKIPV